MAEKAIDGAAAASESELLDLSGPNDKIGFQFKFEIGTVTAMKIAIDTSLTSEIDPSEAYEHTVTADEIAAGYGKVTIDDILAEWGKLRITSMTGVGPVDVWLGILRRY